MARVRLALLYAVPAVVIAGTWMRIEKPQPELARVAALAAIALVPALFRSARYRVSALLVALVTGFWIALQASPLEPGRLLTRLGSGTLEFYDIVLPFDAHAHPRMEGAALVAVLAFCVALALALAAQKALLASSLVVLGAGWPGTLLRGGNQLLVGGLILAAVLVILMGLRPRAGRALVPAVIAGASIVGISLAVSSSPAVAKRELVHWEGWDLYTKPQRAVSISYVWNSDYSGLHWPKKATTVLEIAAPERPLYWRATTLDEFVGDNWVENLTPVSPVRDEGRVVLSNDPLLPPRARRSTQWVKQTVAVRALDDRHLVGADAPIAYGAGAVQSVSYENGGTAVVRPGSDRDKSYTVWSYVPRPTPAQLARSRPVYPVAIRDGGFLAVDRRTSVPPFAAPGRDPIVADLISTHLPAYHALYQEAKRVVGNARNPYAAVVGLESWLRESGRFHYDEQPAQVEGIPPLVTFLTATRRGYCQHFAGAMALMLRYLGIPARVAAGFTSGKYRDGTWIVRDRDAHSWVEVWFRGYGWLPFDPTPGRGRLAASYTASSPSFDASAAAALVGGKALRSLLESRARAQDAARGQTRGEHARSVPVAPSGRSRRLPLIGLLLLALLAAAIAFHLAKVVRRRSRYLTRDPRLLASACRHELVEFLLDQRVEVGRSATLGELAETIRTEYEVAAERFAHAVGAARFCAPEAAPEAALRARSELRELRRVLRRRLGTVDRLSGALSLRSLRGA